jgi:hypothetical protein
MLTPRPRGPLSDGLLRAMRTAPGELGPVPDASEAADAADAALALWVLHELHYRGFDDVPDELEWEPGLLTLRVALERDLEARLRERFTAPQGVSFVDDVLQWIDDQDGASVASFVQRRATYDQAVELLQARSVYHLKESDPVAWVVPRLGTRPKAALMELQYDEYGVGDPNRLHHHLFELGLEASGLDATYGAYVDTAPAEALEQNNAMSLFGLHRRLRAAALGHLAAFEATSSLPSRRMVQGLERLGFPAEMSRYYAEHVEADAVHEQLAVRTILGSLLEEEPELEEDAWFGVFTCLDLEDRFARTMLARWGVGDTDGTEDAPATPTTATTPAAVAAPHREDVA